MLKDRLIWMQVSTGKSQVMNKQHTMCISRARVKTKKQINSKTRVAKCEASRFGKVWLQ